jgi:hypothetical protein
LRIEDWREHAAEVIRNQIRNPQSTIRNVHDAGYGLFLGSASSARAPRRIPTIE